MIAYVYLDIDGVGSLKTVDYIEKTDPGFFSRNVALIVKHWKIDTDDQSSVDRVIMYLKVAMEISRLNDFCKLIGINPVYVQNFEPHPLPVSKRLKFDDCKIQLR